MVLTVPPIRKNFFGYKSPEPIPTSFPGMLVLFHNIDGHSTLLARPASYDLANGADV